ncbi:MAG TPA: primosomal protein N' [Magnetospirillaceae bacterium]|nr:primosomal protein N' [Magnetospirillaceae bacterium]
MRYYYLVAPLVVVRANEHAFTYHSPSPLTVGTLVRISVGKRLSNGVVLQVIAAKPSFVTKAVGDVLSPQPLPKPLVTLVQWISQYYAAHLATVLQAVLPAGLQKQRRKTLKSALHPIRKRTNIVLNNEQQQALTTINQRPTGTFFVHGVTGSGKTQVYIEAVRDVVLKGKSAIVLVPEIALTPQLVAEFGNHFQNLIVTHSGLTESDRHQLWLKALQNSAEPLVVIGPRSALFMPLAQLGIIVIDECHEPSYKQEQSPRYSALRAASILAKEHGAKLILGSATPSVADYYLAETTASPILRLPKPAAQLKPVSIEIVDLTVRSNFSRHRFISNKLLDAIESALAKKYQILLFHNRRGTAPTTLCEHCGWTAHCPTCFLPLTLHADKHALTCHLCGFSSKVPPNCPECREPTVIFKGIGTKLIETEIARLFPKARVARFDADTNKVDAIHNRYQALYDGEIDIMIGTQMLAKGLDIPRLSLVGVIQADSGLVLPDYTSEERVFQLLYQVIGRAGRGEHAGEVVIQTYQPQHAVVKAAVARDSASFYQSELQHRKAGRFPPFRHLLKLTCRYKTEAGAVHASQKYAAELRKTYPQVEVLGPTPAFHERLGGNYHWQLVIKARRRGDLVTIAQHAPTGWQADLDPASLL